jgi:hypothetical protein
MVSRGIDTGHLMAVEPALSMVKACQLDISR